MATINGVRAKVLKILDAQLENIQASLENVTNVSDRLVVATELAAILKVLHNLTPIEEDSNGQEQTQKPSAKAAEEIFS